MKKALKLFLLLAIIGVIITAVVSTILYSKYKGAIAEPNSDSAEKIAFEISSGESLDSIAASLVEAGILDESNKKYFVYYARIEGIYSGIQAGHFSIPANLTIKEIGETLRNAGIPETWVTIPEGLRADEIADIIAEEFASVENAQFDRAKFMSLVTDQAFIAEQNLTADNANITTLEGFIYPDKYLLANDTTAKELMLQMLENFKTRVGEDITYDQLILASLVEKEARTEVDRKLVADVIQKRIDEGWFLGLDVTFLYYHQDWLRVLTYQDLEADHPYNSRTKTGLPPTPICNPGIMSINATLNPTPNSYYYFIATEDDGTMYYSETLEGHEANVQQYLR